MSSLWARGRPVEWRPWSWLGVGCGWCLEQGGWHLPDDLTGGKPEGELTALKQWNSSPNVRQNPADYPVDSTESPVEPLMFNGVGGSTTMFAGHWVRALPSDFRVKTLDGVAEDWPFTYEDLRPFYDEVTHHIGASGLEGDPAYPDRTLSRCRPCRSASTA